MTFMKPGNLWRKRLTDETKLPVVKPIPAKMRKRYGRGTIVVPSPHEVAQGHSVVRKGARFLVDGYEEKLVET
jgi:hypothetical protein